MSLTADSSFRGLVLTGLVFASAITTANAVTSVFSQETVGAKVGNFVVAGIVTGGTAIAAGTILRPRYTTTVTTSPRRF